MESNGSQSVGCFAPKLRIVSLVLTIAVIGACSLAACGTPSEQSNAAQTALPAANLAENSLIATAVSTRTTIPATITPLATSTEGVVYPPPLLAATKEAAWTAVAQHDSELGTAVALTHEPTRTPGEPPIYPTWTPIMGILSACPGTGSRGPHCDNAWRGVIGGEIVEVRAGREGSDGDMSQGLITVNNWHTHAFSIYRTPQRIGPVHIASVNGTVFTLTLAESPWTTPAPSLIFLFDLETRQWINP